MFRPGCLPRGGSAIVIHDDFRLRRVEGGGEVLFTLFVHVFRTLNLSTINKWDSTTQLGLICPARTVENPVRSAYESPLYVFLFILLGPMLAPAVRGSLQALAKAYLASLLQPLMSTFMYRLVDVSREGGLSR